MRITIYNEYGRDQQSVAGKRAYKNGLHCEIASIFDGVEDAVINRIVTIDTLLNDPENGLTEQCLAETDVLFWWGHCRHDDVPDEVVDRVERRVKEGMGIIFLHSAHFSKAIKRLLGTPCSLRWREMREAERLWICNMNHPIAQGIEQGFRLTAEEMYGEYFNIPQPDDIIFLGWFQGGDVFRSGVTFHNEKGRIFYFQPGHETFPTYKNANVRKILYNAARWVNHQEDMIPVVNTTTADAPHVPNCEFFIRSKFGRKAK